MILTEYPRFNILHPKESDSSLAGSWLTSATSDPLHDFSNAGNDLTLSGTVTLGHKGSLFDGTSGYARKAIANFRSSDTAGALSVWVKRTAAGAAAETIFASVDEAADVEKFILSIASNRVWFTSRSSTGVHNQVYADAAIAAGRWYHIVVVSTGTAYAIYIDGEAQTVMVNTGSNDGQWIGAIPNRDSIVIGADPSNAGVANYLNATVAACTLYSAAVTADWVSADHAKGVPDSTVALAVDTGDRDKSGKGHTLTASGGIVLGPRMTLDGTDDKLDAGDIGTITEISAWIRPSTTTEELFLVDAGKDIMVNSGTITYTGLTATATYVDGEAGTTLAAGKWSHVVCQFSATDANNMELGNDGANYGAFDCDIWVARTASRTAGAIAKEYEQTRGLKR